MVLLAGCATMDGGAPVVDATPQPCDVTVTFGSFAMGVDQDLKARIQGVITAETGVRDVEERRWGREGESDLCIHAPAPVADSLYTRIADLIPATSERAPTSVLHRDGRRKASAWSNAR